MEISIICDTGEKLEVKNFEKRCRLRKTNKRTRCVKNECFSARDILWGRIKHYEKSSLRSHYRFRCALTSVPTPFGFLLLKKNIRFCTLLHTRTHKYSTSTNTYAHLRTLTHIYTHLRTTGHNWPELSTITPQLQHNYSGPKRYI